MPNISGTFTQYTYDTSQFSAAFSETLLNDFGNDGRGVDTRWVRSTLNASKGEGKTDGTLKTSSEHKAYGTSNFVTPKNITIKLCKRIS